MDYVHVLVSTALVLRSEVRQQLLISSNSHNFRTAVEINFVFLVVSMYGLIVLNTTAVRTNTVRKTELIFFDFTLVSICLKRRNNLIQV